MIRSLLAAAAAFLMLCLPASAAKQEYALSLVGVSDGQASFSVTRSELRKRGLEAVQVECYDAAGAESYQQNYVAWGLWDSLEGSSSVGVSGVWCEAFVTNDPHYRQPKSNVVEFAP